MGRDDTPPRGLFDSIDALECWAESYIANPAVIRGGCSFWIARQRNPSPTYTTPSPTASHAGAQSFATA